MRYVLTLWLLINGKQHQLDVATFHSRLGCYTASRLAVTVKINNGSVHTLRARRFECRPIRRATKK